MIFKWKINTLLLIYILFVNSLSILSAANFEKDPNIFVSTTQTNGEADVLLKDLINRISSEELRNSGFNVIEVEVHRDRQELVQAAEWMDAYYLIENSFQIENSQIEWEINCYSVIDDLILYRDSQTMSPEFFTDVKIREIFKKIIPLIRDNMRAIENDRISPPNPLQSEESEKEPDDVTDQNIINHVKPFFLQWEVGPLLAIGDVTQYFTVGFETHIYAAYQFYKQERFNMNLGLYSGVNYFNAEGSLASSENWLISLGPGFRMAYEVNSRMDLFYRLSLGVSIYSTSTNNMDYMSKIIPYGSLGAGIDINILDYMGCSLFIKYDLFLEGSTPIQSLAPGAGISIKF